MLAGDENQCMIDLGVKLKVDVDSGKNWGEI